MHPSPTTPEERKEPPAGCGAPRMGGEDTSGLHRNGGRGLKTEPGTPRPAPLRQTDEISLDPVATVYVRDEPDTLPTIRGVETLGPTGVRGGFEGALPLRRTGKEGGPVTRPNPSYVHRVIRHGWAPGPWGRGWRRRRRRLKNLGTPGYTTLHRRGGGWESRATEPPKRRRSLRVSAGGAQDRTGAVVGPGRPPQSSEVRELSVDAGAHTEPLQVLVLYPT